MKPITNIDDPRYVKALAHPLRIRVLALLEEQTASPVELADRLGESLGTVAYHVRTLLNLGLLELVTTRQRRGAVEHVYRVRDHPRFTDESWDALSPIAKQRLLSAMLSQIGEYATGSAAAGGFDRSDSHLTRTALKLDERGWMQLAQATKTWLQQVQKIEQAALERVNRRPCDHELFDVGLVVMLFEALPFSARSSTETTTKPDRRSTSARAARRTRPVRRPRMA